MRVPNPLGGSLVLDVLYESNGFGTLVDDKAVNQTRARICAAEGLHLCPEGAACLVALEIERKNGRVGLDDRVVVFNSASGLKYPMPSMKQSLKKGDQVDSVNNFTDEAITFIWSRVFKVSVSPAHRHTLSTPDRVC